MALTMEDSVVLRVVYNPLYIFGTSATISTIRYVHSLVPFIPH
jgi:hypothetical protein